ncbi:M24 family metallopeptidase [Desulforudis sp. DRI-14]|uniref:M24 family metallopeptidase n=1 Tax=Desulforudis sp. DRI-14 TaxID=3459793 RepID=UPI003BB9F328
MELREEYRERQRRFQELLGQNGIDGALIVQSADLVYLTGTYQDMHLYLPAEGEPLLMVRRDLEVAQTDACVEKIVPLQRFSEIPGLMLDHSLALPARLGLELDVLPAAYYLKYQSVFKNAELVDCSSLLRRLRAVKTPWEISILRAGGKALDALFEALPGLLELGRTELELAGRLEALARARGHQGYVRVRGFNAEVFWGHLLSGANAAHSSYFDGVIGGAGSGPWMRFGAGSKRIASGEIILVDYPGVWQGYTVDMTRIFAFGAPDRRLIAAHALALEIQESLADKMRPGVKAGDLYDVAWEMAGRAGRAHNFMGLRAPVSFIGHGVGIELNEWPVLARGSESRLETGNVIAIEPKFVFEGLGTVGIENTFLVTEDGAERLTRYPDDMHIL